MPRTYDLIEAQDAAHFAAARALIEEYAKQIAAALDVDLGFQDFAAELNRLADMYGPPTGCLILAGGHDGWVGCCALRRFADGVCEMKRLYIKPSARGAQLGRRLAERIVSKAQMLGYQRMVLDTLQDMIPAQTLYRSLGFRETEPYYFNPLAAVTYMELVLRPGIIANPRPGTAGSDGSS
jgi:ribosomal protein S18 acetylase RimI-like enzyme